MKSNEEICSVLHTAIFGQMLNECFEAHKSLIKY